MQIPDLSMQQRTLYPQMMVPLNKQVNLPGGIFPYYQNPSNPPFMTTPLPTNYAFNQQNSNPNLHSAPFIRNNFHSNMGYSSGTYPQTQPLTQPNLSLPFIETQNPRVEANLPYITPEAANDLKLP